jgi:hypothetical protein
VKAGIIGLSSVGKSTLFQLLTGAAPAPAGGRPEPRLGMARVPDARVEGLAKIFAPKKKTLATVDYVDVPGVGKGEGSALVDCSAPVKSRTSSMIWNAAPILSPKSFSACAPGAETLLSIAPNRQHTPHRLPVLRRRISK